MCVGSSGSLLSWTTFRDWQTDCSLFGDQYQFSENSINNSFEVRHPLQWQLTRFLELLSFLSSLIFVKFLVNSFACIRDQC